MKVYSMIYPAIVGVLTLGLVSCSGDDDIPASSVPEAVTESFNAQFPNAKGVEWQIDQQYYVADFNMNTFDTEAWFTANGAWAMTETDYETMVSMLPIQVSDAFNDSQYASWIVDDVTLYEKPADSFCVIEVENTNATEIALFYDMYGNLLNKVSDICFDITPTTDPTSINF